MNTATRNLVVYWLAPLVWMSIVLVASSDVFSSEHTGSVLSVFLGWLPAAYFDFLHLAIRKLAHLSEYGVLTFLFFRAWRGPAAGWSMLWARRAFACCLAVAAIDEFHQSFVPSRTSKVQDVLIDVCGGMLALLITHWLTSRKRSASAAGLSVET